MRRTVMMVGMLAALITSTAGLALANGRDGADWRNDDAQCRTGTRVVVRFDGGRGSGGFGWSQGRHVQDDRRFGHGGGWRSGRGYDRGFDDRNDRRFGDRNDRGARDGRGGFDGRGGESRRPTTMPDRNDRGW